MAPTVPSPSGGRGRSRPNSMQQEQLRRLLQHQIIGNSSSPSASAMANRADGINAHRHVRHLSMDRLRQNIQSRGYDAEDAAVLANIFQRKLREMHDETGQPVMMGQLVKGIKNLAAAEVEKLDAVAVVDDEDGDDDEVMDDFEDILGMPLHVAFPLPNDKTGGSLLERVGVSIKDYCQKGAGSLAKKFNFQDWVLDAHWDSQSPYSNPVAVHPPSTTSNRGRDILTALCQCAELAIEIGKHLPAEDVLTLYSVSKAFNHSVNSHLLASIKTWITHKAPEAGRVFPFQLYKRHLVRDPTGRTWRDFGESIADSSPEGARARAIPGLKYLQMILRRDRYCRDILAIMARNGHLMPKTMHGTLLRLWLLMEISTSHQRRAFLQNDKIWTNQHVYNAQFFFVKLCLHFNDPVYGPSTHDLLHLMMGQKGLFMLWQLLMRKRFTKLHEVVRLKTFYDVRIPSCHRPLTDIHGVPLHLVGIGHLEGWGLGTNHLERPDELIPFEAVRRGLELEKHLMHMAIWGYFDWSTGENVVPTEDDLYISDDEQMLAHADTTHHWKPKHARKKRFAQLTPEQQAAIVDEDEDDRLRAMAWCGEDIDDYDSDGEDTPYSLDDELDRGFIVPPVPKDAAPAPALHNQQAWNAFVDQVMFELPPAMDEDEILRAQAWQSYQDGESSGSWDWQHWLNHRQAESVGSSSRPSTSGTFTTTNTTNTTMSTV